MKKRDGSPSAAPRTALRRRGCVLGLLLATTVPAGCAQLGGPGAGPCAQYMIGGAVLGGVLGATSGGESRKERAGRAAIGATAGAAAGYAVCVRVWRQKAALEAKFAALDSAGGGATMDPANRVVRSVEVLENRALRLDLNLTFPTGQSQLPPRAAGYLDAIASTLGDSRVRISGHTDNVGSPASNRTLSYRRAQAVKDFLAARGVSADRLQVEGLGSDVPVADNSTPEGRARNRRVEITIVPVVATAGATE